MAENKYNRLCLAILNNKTAVNPSRQQPIKRKIQSTSSSEELKVMRFSNAGSKVPIGEVKAWIFSPGV
ncbi:MAG: hypothetical protein PHO70_01615 [Candidatus Omnitrophica bacterium]|nr:hypothetical protein [Candidatus Omnitrophota bacterium]